MASTKVVCKYCRQQFDRQYSEYVKVATRYAHKSCYEKEQKENAERTRLTDFIKELYAPYEPDWTMIGSQIKRYRDEGKTYEGMYYTLYYFFIILKKPIHESRGIGIIPYVYDRARAYYANRDTIYTQIAEVKKKTEEITQQTEEIVMVTPKKREKKLIDFSYDD